MEAGVWNHVNLITFGEWTTTAPSRNIGLVIQGQHGNTYFTPKENGWALALGTDQRIDIALLSAGFRSENPKLNHTEGDETYKQEGDGMVLHVVIPKPPSDRWVFTHFDAGGGKIWNLDHLVEVLGRATHPDEVTRGLANSPAALHLRNISSGMDKLLIDGQRTRTKY